MLSTDVINNDMPDWLVKCLSCTHSYSRKGDDDYIYCRCRTGCHFKQTKNKPRYKNERVD